MPKFVITLTSPHGVSVDTTHTQEAAELIATLWESQGVGNTARIACPQHAEAKAAA